MPLRSGMVQWLVSKRGCRCSEITPRLSESRGLLPSPLRRLIRRPSLILSLSLSPSRNPFHFSLHIPSPSISLLPFPFPLPLPALLSRTPFFFSLSALPRGEPYLSLSFSLRFVPFLLPLAYLLATLPTISRA